MKKPMYMLFAVAALMLTGRLTAHSVVSSHSHGGYVMQAAAGEPTSTDPGDPDGPNGPDGGPDGEGDGGPGAV